MFKYKQRNKQCQNIKKRKVKRQTNIIKTQTNSVKGETIFVKRQTNSVKRQTNSVKSQTNIIIRQSLIRMPLKYLHFLISQYINIFMFIAIHFTLSIVCTKLDEINAINFKHNLFKKWLAKTEKRISECLDYWLQCVLLKVILLIFFMDRAKITSGQKIGVIFS